MTWIQIYLVNSHLSFPFSLFWVLVGFNNIKWEKKNASIYILVVRYTHIKQTERPIVRLVCAHLSFDMRESFTLFNFKKRNRTYTHIINISSNKRGTMNTFSLSVGLNTQNVKWEEKKANQTKSHQNKKRSFSDSSVLSIFLIRLWLALRQWTINQSNEIFLITSISINGFFSSHNLVVLLFDF